MIIKKAAMRCDQCGEKTTQNKVRHIDGQFQLVCNDCDQERSWLYESEQTASND